MINNQIKEALDIIYNIEVVNENPTFYLYNLNDISEKINNIARNAPSNLNLYYAMKANPNKTVLKHMSANADIKGVEIASYGELMEALKYFKHDNIIFTGPGKTEKELMTSIANGIKTINCESAIEAFRLNKIAEELGRKVDILIRVNTNYHIDGAEEHMAGISTKMGIDEDDVSAIYNVIKEYKNINICGIHVFSASGIMDYELLIKYIDYVFDLTSKLEKNGMPISIIDFGGGIGIDYSREHKQFDIESYFSEMKKLVDKYGFHSKEFILELGTYLVGECGFYSTRIIDIKEIKGMKHIITAGGFHHIRLPVATHRKSPVFILNNNEEHFCNLQIGVEKEVVNIDGPLCMDEDRLSWDEYVEKAEIGDYVVITQAGAYCYSAAGLVFLSHELPFEFSLNSKGDIIYG